MQPTEEQIAVVDAALDGEPLKVDARAGAGKTSSLGLVSTAKGRARGVYLAFNKEIAEEAKRKFPLSVRCGTVNSQAYRSVSGDITRKLRNPLEPNYLLAERFPSRLGELLTRDTSVNANASTEHHRTAPRTSGLPLPAHASDALDAMLATA